MNEPSDFLFSVCHCLVDMNEVVVVSLIFTAAQCMQGFWTYLLSSRCTTCETPCCKFVRDPIDEENVMELQNQQQQALAGQTRSRRPSVSSDAPVGIAGADH